MSRMTTIAARLDEDTLALIDKVAQAQGRSREAFATRAVERAAREEARFLAFIQEGIDDIEAGRVVPHEVVMAELEAMIAKQEARCRG